MSFKGIGFGLIYVPAIVSVGYYFDKKRSFATGIAVCGSGIGTFVLSPINRILFDNFGIEGAFLFKAGFCLNMVVCGILFRPIAIEPSEISKKNKKLALKAPLNDIKSSGESKKFIESKDMPKIFVSDENNHVLEQQTSKKQISKIADSLPEVNRLSSNNKLDVNSSDVNQYATSLPMLNDDPANNDNKVRSRAMSKNSQFKASNSAMDMMIMIRSLQNIPVVKEEDEGQPKSKMKKFRDKLKESMDFSLLKDFIFFFFAISNFLTSLAFNTPFIYIVDQAISMGINANKADLLLSTIGISNTVGRIILGVVSNLKNVNRLYLYSTVITICGIATAIEPFCTNFTGLFIYAIVFGITSGNFFMFNFDLS
jgi:predicted MFS family arabinose efflux permease